MDLNLIPQKFRNVRDLIEIVKRDLLTVHLIPRTNNLKNAKHFVKKVDLDTLYKQLIDISQEENDLRLIQKFMFRVNRKNKRQESPEIRKIFIKKLKDVTTFITEPNDFKVPDNFNIFDNNITPLEESEPSTSTEDQINDLPEDIDENEQEDVKNTEEPSKDQVEDISDLPEGFTGDTPSEDTNFDTEPIMPLNNFGNMLNAEELDMLNKQFERFKEQIVEPQEEFKSNVKQSQDSFLDQPNFKEDAQNMFNLDEDNLRTLDNENLLKLSNKIKQNNQLEAQQNQEQNQPQPQPELPQNQEQPQPENVPPPEEPPEEEFQDMPEDISEEDEPEEIKEPIQKECFDTCDKSNILIFLGITGSGKSNANKIWLANNLQNYVEIIIFSGTALKNKEYDQLRDSHANFKIFDRVDDEDLDFIYKRRYAMEDPKENPMLIIFDDIVGMNDTARWFSRSHMIRKLGAQGRHFGITINFIVQQYNVIPTLLRRNTKTLFLFNVDSTELALVYKDTQPKIKKKTFIVGINDIVDEIGFAVIYDKINGQRWLETQIPLYDPNAELGSQRMEINRPLFNSEKTVLRKSFR